MGWIVIRNWDRFQHYGDRRNPPWIKLYLALLHDDDFQHLTPNDRITLIELWLLYAMTRQKVRDDTRKLTRACGHRVTKATLERLTHAGFIDIAASSPASTIRSREEEIQREDLLADLKPVDNSEPPRDPEALEKLKEIAARIGRPVADDE